MALRVIVEVEGEKSVEWHFVENVYELMTDFGDAFMKTSVVVHDCFDEIN